MGKKIHTLAVFLYDEILPLIPPGREKKTVHIATPNHGVIQVKMGGLRMNTFLDSPTCVKCGKIGFLWLLQACKRERPHFNLYTEFEDTDPKHCKMDQDGLLLLTIDHVIPRRLHGPDDPTNLVTMCAACNQDKGGKIDPSVLRPDKPLFEADIVQEARKMLAMHGTNTRAIKDSDAFVAGNNKRFRRFLWPEQLIATANELAPPTDQSRWVGNFFDLDNLEVS